MTNKKQKEEYATERNYEKVGAFLYEARIKANLTQREVSMQLGYASAQHISNFERGLAVPPAKKLEGFVRLYKIKPEKLVDLILECERDVMLEAAANKRAR